jgi:flagellar biosynthesis protein FlhG
MMDQAQKLRQIVGNLREQRLLKEKVNSRIITITSGKGGVGKTNFTVNFAIALAELGYRVLIIDADFGLANIDVVLGIIPQYDLSHVINAQKELNDIITEGPCGIKFISGGSGIHELVCLDSCHLEHFIASMSKLDSIVDIILIDTGAGLTDSVLRMVLAASETILITTSEPTAVTDVYALIKMIAAIDKDIRLKLVVNKTDNMQEAKDTYDKLNTVVRRFLGMELEGLGYLLYDHVVPKSVKLQNPFILTYPNSVAAKQIRRIANSYITKQDPISRNSQGMLTFIRKLRSFLRN